MPLALQSQSTKLCVFEERVLAIVSNTKDLPETLATSGKITLSRKGIAQLIGQVSGLWTPVQRSRCWLATSGVSLGQGLEQVSGVAAGAALDSLLALAAMDCPATAAALPCAMLLQPVTGCPTGGRLGSP